ncbi:MAG TPA: GyrI-like domain-containing protein [Nitrososphaerales archaeon]|nr:GyrI-like domain-containing protein [Nitrososphaerales archaeon]
MSVTKLDLRKQLKPLYSPHGVELVKVPPMKYIMVEGAGQPGGESFQQAMGVIYNVAYTLKFRAKRLLKKDYNVMAPEGLWWTRSGRAVPDKPDEWLWTLMVVVPDFVTNKMFFDAVEEVRSKKHPPGLDRARLEAFDEGYCVQTMHVGPYSNESESIAKMDAYARERGYVMVGKHHEIYLGDPRRAAPTKLKTVIRHPVAEGP